MPLKSAAAFLAHIAHPTLSTKAETDDQILAAPLQCMGIKLIWQEPGKSRKKEKAPHHKEPFARTLEAVGTRVGAYGEAFRKPWISRLDIMPCRRGTGL